jgi:hypothetical protein
MRTELQAVWAGSLWPKLDGPDASPTTILDSPDERTFDRTNLQTPYERSLDSDRSFAYSMGIARIGRAERKGHHGQQDEHERAGSNRLRSQADERSPGSGRERSRDQRQTRSRVSPPDVHSSGRGEGYDVGTHERADERSGRSFPRASFARSARGERLVTFAPKVERSNHMAAPPFDRSIDVQADNERCRV